MPSSIGLRPWRCSSSEYKQALGKFLPDQEQPNEGVFSIQENDEQGLPLSELVIAPKCATRSVGWRRRRLIRRCWGFSGRMGAEANFGVDKLKCCANN